MLLCKGLLLRRGIDPVYIFCKQTCILYVLTLYLYYIPYISVYRHRQISIYNVHIAFYVHRLTIPTFVGVYSISTLCLLYIYTHIFQLFWSRLYYFPRQPLRCPGCWGSSAPAPSWQPGGTPEMLRPCGSKLSPASLCIHMYSYMYVYIHTCIYIYMYICIYSSILSIYSFLCVNIDIHAYSVDCYIYSMLYTRQIHI